MAQTFAPIAFVALAAALAGAAGPAGAATSSPSAVGKSGQEKLQEQIKALSLQLAATAKSAGVPGPRMDHDALKAHVEEALLGVLSQSGTDASVGAAALRLALGDPQLTAVEIEAIRELLQKVAKAAGVEPGALGRGVDLIPPPPGGIAGGGSGYRTE